MNISIDKNYTVATSKHVKSYVEGSSITVTKQERVRFSQEKRLYYSSVIYGKRSRPHVYKFQNLN